MAWHRVALNSLLLGFTPGHEAEKSNVIPCIVPCDHLNEDGASTSLTKVGRVVPIR